MIVKLRAGIGGPYLKPNPSPSPSPNPSPDPSPNSKQPTVVIGSRQAFVKQAMVCVHAKVIYVCAKAAVEDLGSDAVLQ